MEEKKDRGMLERLEEVVVVCGSNDLGKRNGTTRMSSKQFAERMDGFVGCLLGMLPRVRVRVLDVLARGGEFNEGVRMWSRMSGKWRSGEWERVEHVVCWKVFAKESGDWHRKKEVGMEPRGDRYVQREGFFGVNRFKDK